MRTVFQLLLLITFVLFSPLVFLVLAMRLAAPTTLMLKAELVKKDVYVSAVTELQKKIDATLIDAPSDDPMRLVAPFVKKEITPLYVRGKIETLIDDTGNWMMDTGPSPVLSFLDLKEKLVKQHSTIIAQLEDALSEIEAQQERMSDEQAAGSTDALPFSRNDLDGLLKGNFTIPVGTYLASMKLAMSVFKIASLVLIAGYACSILLIVLLAQSLKSKLQWIGWTLLLTTLWNIPGIIVSASVALTISKTITQSMTGAQYILPFVDVFLTSIVTAYARVTTGSVVALGLFAVGILVVSLFAQTTQVSAQPSALVSKKK